jgi:hypothetical protein
MVTAFVQETEAYGEFDTFEDARDAIEAVSPPLQYEDYSSDDSRQWLCINEDGVAVALIVEVD